MCYFIRLILIKKADNRNRKLILTQGIPLVGQKLLTLLNHVSSSLVFSVARLSLVFSVARLSLVFSVARLSLVFSVARVVLS
jgi:hypothetical protein